MDLHICSVKTNSPVVIIWVYVMTTQKRQSHKIFSLEYHTLSLHILRENLAGGLGFRREPCWSFVFMIENKPKKLILKSIFPLKGAVEA